MVGGLPTALESEYITYCNETYTTAKITLIFTGSIKFEITADGNSATPTWDEVTLTSGVETTHTFTTSGGKIMYRMIGLDGAQLTSTGTTPAIKIQYS